MEKYSKLSKEQPTINLSVFEVTSCQTKPCLCELRIRKLTGTTVNIFWDV